MVLTYLEGFCRRKLSSERVVDPGERSRPSCSSIAHFWTCVCTSSVLGGCHSWRGFSFLCKSRHGDMWTKIFKPKKKWGFFRPVARPAKKLDRVRADAGRVQRRGNNNKEAEDNQTTHIVYALKTFDTVRCQASGPQIEENYPHRRISCLFPETSGLCMHFRENSSVFSGWDPITASLRNSPGDTSSCTSLRDLDCCFEKEHETIVKRDE